MRLLIPHSNSQPSAQICSEKESKEFAGSCSFIQANDFHQGCYNILACLVPWSQRYILYTYFYIICIISHVMAILPMYYWQQDTL